MQIDNSYGSYGRGSVAAEAPVDIRREFIRKTYAHLGGAVGVFVLLELMYFKTGIAATVFKALVNAGGQMAWLGVLGGFMLVSYVAARFARSNASPALQYLGLGLYVAAESLIFIPLLYISAYYAKDPNIIPMAGIYTGLIFGALTAVVFVTKKDFSFMRGALMIGGIAAFGVILCSIFFGFSLGNVFCGAMILLMAGYILYYTSNVMNHYPIGSHVAASLALFSAIATLFWYILSILNNRR